ncbi:MAG: amidohydrolase family protein [Lentisphaeria bacterium]|nr:amidohydrolase family protein [Lentisphaeria bacterium]
MNKCIWNTPGTLAEKFWRDGRGDFPIYDMHGHMGAHYAICFKRCEAPEMVAHVKRIGVKRLVFSHHEALWGNIRNAQVCDICRQFPDTLRMYAGIIPQRQDRIKEDISMFDRWAPYALGLKLLPGYHSTNAMDPRYEYALAFANERKLPVLIHTWGNDTAILDVVQKYPDAKFFLGHSCYGAWDLAFRCVRESNNNTFLELTAIPGDRGIIEKLVSGVGSEKILFGTDMPWFDEYQAVGGVLAARISDDDKLNILSRNPERILGKDF